jgi:very-short-patch-repair endonuclease
MIKIAEVVGKPDRTISFGSVIAAPTLVAEADCRQHVDNAPDVFHTAWLEARGARPVRFRGQEIMGETEGVLKTLLAVVEGAL